MRIECDNCSKQYNIADEKIVGKMLKVRCKNCGNMIPVDGRDLDLGPSPDEATRVVDVAFPKDGSAEWFVVIEGDQQGPFTADDLKSRFLDGEITAEVFVWKDGMADWDALGSIPEFSDWAAPPEDDYDDESTRVVGGADDSSGFGMDGVASFPTGALSSIAPPESTREAFAGAAAAETGRDAFFSTSRQSAIGGDSIASSAIGARNESSVLFSLDSLASSRSSRKDDGANTEESGLINLQGLIDTRNVTSDSGELGLAAGAATASGAPIPMPTTAISALPPQKKSNAMLYVAIAALVVIVALGGVLIWILMQPPAGEVPAHVAQAPEEVPAQPEPEAEPAGEPEPEEPAVAAAEEEPEAEEPEAEEPETDESEEEEAQAGAEGEEPAAEQAAAPSRPAQQQAAAPSRPAQQQAAAQPAQESGRSAPTSVAVTPPAQPQQQQQAPPSRPSQPAEPSDERVASVLDSIRGGSEPARPAAAAAAQPSLPQSLQREDVQATIRRYQARVARCRPASAEPQRYVSSFVIQPSGSVTNVSVDPSDDVGTCLSGVVRDFQFPRFSGDPMPVQYPFRL